MLIYRSGGSCVSVQRTMVPVMKHTILFSVSVCQMPISGDVAGRMLRRPARRDTASNATTCTTMTSAITSRDAQRRPIATRVAVTCTTGNLLASSVLLNQRTVYLLTGLRTGPAASSTVWERFLFLHPSIHRWAGDIMFSGCPPVCACVTRVEAFSDRLVSLPRTDDTLQRSV